MSSCLADQYISDVRSFAYLWYIDNIQVTAYQRLLPGHPQLGEQCLHRWLGSSRNVEKIMDIRSGSLGALPFDRSTHMLMDLIELTARDDDRMWIPESSPNCWWRPLMFDLASGNHWELFRVKRNGILSKHLHPTPVCGFVLKGSWRYLEHDWVAEPGAFVYEPPGEVHTLVCDDADEMLTLFNISGPIVYVDDNHQVVAVDDNRTIIERAKAHYAANGIGADYVERLLR